MNLSLAAGIAFFALGANVLGTIVLLLLNPRSRGVRWYAGFQAAMVTWLFAQGMRMATGDAATWYGVHALAVHLLPLLFVCFAIAEGTRRSDRQVLAVLAAGLVAVVALWGGTPSPSALRGYGFWAWHLAGWGAGMHLLFRHNRKAFATGARTGESGRWVSAALLLLIPAIVVVGITVGSAFFIYGMPLVTVLILLLLFTGVARHRFYDIEVRAARTGELAARAAEQERLAVLGEVAASVAHEVRNPLTGLQSLAQRLAEDDVDEPRRRRYASVMVEEARRLDRIVRNLLDLARRAPSADERAGEETPLDELFEDVRLLVAGRAGRVGVRVEADGRGITAPAPRDALAQALLNLTLNAIAHSPRGGRVLLAARAPEPGVTEIAVRDEGPGVPAGDRARIFEPFEATRGGTGLGLAVVRRIAGERGWAVEVGDAAGGGAEFRVIVKATSPEPERRSEP